MVWDVCLVWGWFGGLFFDLGMVLVIVVSIRGCFVAPKNPQQQSETVRSSYCVLENYLPTNELPPPRAAAGITAAITLL